MGIISAGFYKPDAIPVTEGSRNQCCRRTEEKQKFVYDSNKCIYTYVSYPIPYWVVVSDIAIFVLKRDVKLQLTNHIVSFALTVLPQPPENLFLLEVTSFSVRMAWNSTSNRLMAPVKSYVVQYQPNGSSDNYAEMSVSKPEVFVDGLSAHTSYEFNIFAVGEVGRSLSAASVVVTTSPSTQTGSSLFRCSAL